MSGEENIKTRKPKLLSGALVLTAILIVAYLWMLHTITGDDLNLFYKGEFPGQPVQVSSAPVDWYELYFTEPVSEPSWSGGLDEILAADIDQAQKSVDIAAYDLDLDSVTSALLRAHDRGVVVRMLLESDNVQLDQPQELIAAGIPLVTDGRGALMHNKFVVIDGRVTWTGSWNYTDSGTYRNNNNAIRITSTELASNYTSEFNEMVLDHIFGPDSPAGSPHQHLVLEGTRIETFFAPEDAVMKELIQVVSQANESIRFMAYSFTDDELGMAMRERAAAGVLVEGVFDSRSADSDYGEFIPMQEAGLRVYPDGCSGVMHHKVIIVDAHIVTLGSFNFSQGADQQNDENLLVIYDAAIAARFLDEFDDVITQAYP